MSPLNGKTILIVEDEPIVAMMVEDMLCDLGAMPVGPASSLEGALELARDGAFDAAILDLNLNGERTGAVAELLRGRGVPFVFATGYDSGGGVTLGDAIVLQKPYRIEQMEAALSKAMAAVVDR
jgi:CheY-like chemotaxis protein